MSQAHYTQEILKKVVAKICLTIGWHSIQSTSLEIMVDILRRYLQEISKLTHGYATLFGHTQPNLDELGLAFRDMHINIADLQEYVRYVDSGLPFEVPFYPVPKESHLNFLKPGSGEVVTRPVHIYEHLPPMYKISDDVEMTEQKKQEETTIQPTNTETTASGAVFKRPADISTNEASVKRPRYIIEQPKSKQNEIVNVFKILKKPDQSKITNQCDMPEISETSDIPEKSEISDKSEILDHSETPEQSQTPNQSETPDQSEIAGQSEIADMSGKANKSKSSKKSNVNLKLVKVPLRYDRNYWKCAN